MQITHAGTPVFHNLIWQEQQHATRISFYSSGKVTVNVTSEKMGVKQGERLHWEYTVWLVLLQIW